MREFCRISPDVRLGENVSIYSFVNLYGCSIGDYSRVRRSSRSRRMPPLARM